MCGCSVLCTFVSVWTRLATGASAARIKGAHGGAVMVPKVLLLLPRGVRAGVNELLKNLVSSTRRTDQFSCCFWRCAIQEAIHAIHKVLPIDIRHGYLDGGAQRSIADLCRQMVVEIENARLTNMP